ncbi:MAG: 50S ribosomal protein L3 [Rickettsiaceae bacterium H1]|nr:50S ribosomal protein L3 [Rickettsiaceae bacterium H1]
MSRIGLLMRKVGCTTIFDSNALTFKAATVLLLEDSCVLSVNETGDSYFVKVGFGSVKANSLNKPQKQFFLKLGIDCKKKVLGFYVSEKYADTLQISKSLSVDFFNLGQFVDVVGESIGKGFAGVIKRHNFSGLANSHGVSISHRSHGSTGQCQDPGRVFKGKKMAGHLGASQVTIQNLRILDVNADKQLLAVSGSVPGAKGGYVLLKDSVKKNFFG